MVIFTSPSTVEHYAALMEGRPTPPLVACIGPVTADAARRAGYHVGVVAADPSAPAVVSAVAAHVADHPVTHRTPGSGPSAP